METKKNLKPGMKVKNLISGKIGELMPDPNKPDQLSPQAADHCVRVKVSKPIYTAWVLDHIELVEK